MFAPDPAANEEADARASGEVACLYITDLQLSARWPRPPPPAGASAAQFGQGQFGRAFVVHLQVPRVQIAAPKHTKVIQIQMLDDSMTSLRGPLSANAIEKAMGRKGS